MHKKLINIVGQDNVFHKELMSRHTTFRVGGPVDFLVTPHSAEEVKQLIELCVAEQVPYFILGNGSNLLVRDQGIAGVAIQLYRNYADFRIEGNEIWAQSGVMLSRLGKAALDEGLTGFEFASGIPGTLGGAVTMNAGAYGGEIKDIIVSATVINENNDIVTLSREELKLGYRTSIISERGYTVLEARLLLSEGDREEIKKYMDELSSRRIEKQPLEYPSAGSTFKRPEGYFAGKLIMDAGLAGYTVGGAQVSEKHCGFVINRGNATASDILQLISDVQEQVESKFGIRLETEVKIL